MCSSLNGSSVEKSLEVRSLSSGHFLDGVLSAVLASLKGCRFHFHV